MPIAKVNLIPKLKCVLDGCYDPKGGFVLSDNPNDPPGTLVQKPWNKDHQPDGEITLSAQDYECFVVLCQRAKVDPGQTQDQGAGGVLVKIASLVAAFAKVTPETEVLVSVQVSE